MTRPSAASTPAVTDTTELVAGRELDALVATKIFGWQAVDGTIIPWLAPVGTNPDGEPLSIVPPYSADIAAGWLVVEQMQASGYRPEIWATDDGLWFAHFAYGESPLVGATYDLSDDPASSAETAPLAICRAALATLASASSVASSADRAAGEASRPD